MEALADRITLPSPLLLAGTSLFMHGVQPDLWIPRKSGCWLAKSCLTNCHVTRV
jgi:hypothetical protein